MTDNAELRRTLVDIAIQLAHVCRTAEREPAACVANQVHAVEMRIADLADTLADEQTSEQQQPTSERREVTITVSYDGPVTIRT